MTNANPQQGHFIEDCSDSDKGVCHCSHLDGFISDFLVDCLCVLGLCFLSALCLACSKGVCCRYEPALCTDLQCSWHVFSTHHQYIFHTPLSDCQTQLTEFVSYLPLTILLYCCLPVPRTLSLGT